jgi:hypothetical protein
MVILDQARGSFLNVKFGEGATVVLTPEATVRAWFSYKMSDKA